MRFFTCWLIDLVILLSIFIFKEIKVLDLVCSSSWVCGPVVSHKGECLVWVVLFILVHLSFKLVNVFLLDRINRSNDIPVYKSGAWWCCDTTFVHPFVPLIYKIHQISIWYIFSCGVAKIIPLKTVEEVINNLLLFSSKDGSVAINTKQDTNCRECQTSFCFPRHMDRVQLKIETLSIYCMLRWVMNMEHLIIESFRTIEEFLCEI